jgi:glycosyltransferase involved in cell wall biosynthesis
MKRKEPFFSIIVPTYNRPRQLRSCLKAISRLDYPRNCFEIIVVDDGNNVCMGPIVASFKDRLDVTLVRQWHAGPAVARNTGAIRAKGEFLAFTDDDCAPASDWLHKLAARFINASDQAVGGKTINALRGNRYSVASQIVVDYLCQWYNTDLEQARFSASNNFAIPAKGFHAIGGFDTTFTHAAAEDREFCDRWLYHGYRLVYAPEVLVYHLHSLTFGTFLKQHFKYGRGSFRFHQAERARHNLKRVRLQPLYFYEHLIKCPFLRAAGQQAFMLSGLMLICQVSTAVGYLWEQMLRTIEKSKEAITYTLIDRKQNEK